MTGYADARKKKNLLRGRSFQDTINLPRRHINAKVIATSEADMNLPKRVYPVPTILLGLNQVRYPAAILIFRFSQSKLTPHL